jgi:hypothetical protein
MINRHLYLSLGCAGLLLLSPGAGASSIDEQLAGYAKAARSSNPAFDGFSAKRGQDFHLRPFAQGKPETPACTTCHGKDLRAPGQTPNGKVVAPMALSVTPTRYADPAKVEKWFKRNCTEVLGRECTAQEKGDWLRYVTAQ